MPEVQRRGICEARKYGQARRIPRVLRLLALSGLRFHDAQYADSGALPEMRSAVCGGEEIKNRFSAHLHQGRVRLGETCARACHRKTSSRETRDQHAA